MALNFERTTQSLSNLTTVAAGIEALCAELAADLHANSGDQAAVDAIADSIDARAVELANAILINTPPVVGSQLDTGAGEPPATEEPAPPDEIEPTPPVVEPPAVEEPSAGEPTEPPATSRALYVVDGDQSDSPDWPPAPLRTEDGRPLFYFEGDLDPGTTNGDGLGGWHVYTGLTVPVE